MLYLLFLTLLFPSAAIAESPLNWTALEVTVDDSFDKKSSDKSPKIKDLGKNDSRFMTAVDKMRADFYTADERNRKVPAVVNQETIYSALAEFLESSYPGGVEGLKASHRQIEEDIYNALKRLPPIAYPYIGPYLHSVPYMSERILNMPGIKETKGKFPTRIAPQMRGYAKKYGKYMSKHLYVFLMPEAWPQPEREESSGKGFAKTIKFKSGMLPSKSLADIYGIPSPDDYRTGKALQKIVRPQTPADKVTQKSPLTEGDVEAALASLKTIRETFGENRFDEFHTALRDMSLSDNNIMEELRNPMQTLAGKIKRLPQAEQFAQTVARHGFTPDSWAITTDKIIKARRVATLNTGDAAGLDHWRKLKRMPPEFYKMTPRDRKITLDSIRLYLDLYTSTEQNVLAVRNYGDNIRKEFATRDMMVLEAPIYGIY